MPRATDLPAAGISLPVCAALIGAFALMATSPRIVAAGVGSTIEVTTTVDSLAVDGECSLREALLAANTNLPVDACAAGTAIVVDSIQLPWPDSGVTYELSIAGAGEDLGMTGDLDVLEPMHLCCGGTIDANGIDRIFDVHPLVERFGFQLTALRHGDAGHGDGGAVRAVGTCHADLARTTLVGISYTLFEENAAENGGAVFIGPCVNAWLQGASLIGNKATATGGALHVAPDGELLLEISTLAQNRAGGSGGGVYASDSVITLASATVAQNEAPHGGGVTVTGDPPVESSFINTLVANNEPSDCAITVTIGGGSNLAGDDSCGSLGPNSLTDTDPMLSPLTSDGTNQRFYEPLPGSPAIDAGTPVSWPPGDQVGRDRPIDGDGDGVAAFDIGSVEAPAPEAEQPGSGGLPSPAPSPGPLPDTAVMPPASTPPVGMWLGVLLTMAALLAWARLRAQ